MSAAPTASLWLRCTVSVYGGADCSTTISCACLLTSCAPPAVAGRPPDAPPAGIPAAAHDPSQPGCNNHLLCHDGELGCLPCSALYGRVPTLSLWAVGLAAPVHQAPKPCKPARPGLPSASAAGTFELLPLLPFTQEDFKPMVKRHKGFKYAAERPQARDFMHQKWGWRATQPGAHRFSCSPTECWAHGHTGTSGEGCPLAGTAKHAHRVLLSCPPPPVSTITIHPLCRLLG